MKISIVTPSLGRITYLDDTIESVVSQAGPFHLQYIIQDGGSGSEVLAVYERWKRRIESGAYPIRCEGIEFRVCVEPDGGPYDAVARGFARADGDILAWLNSDDIYHRGALNTVARIFSGFPQVEWITGQQTIIDSTGSVVMLNQHPDSYSREFLRRGFYQGRNAPLGFPFVQQESTFWRAGLWRGSGACFPDPGCLASDYRLWRRFAEFAPLVKCHTLLGAFRTHGDQLSADAAGYDAGLEPAELAVPAFEEIRRVRRFIADAPDNKFLAYDPGFYNGALPLESLLGGILTWHPASAGWRLSTVPVQCGGFRSVREAMEILNNDNPPAILGKARAFAKRSLPADALRYYDLYLRQRPDDAEAVRERLQLAESTR